MQNFATRLKELRKLKKLKQSDIAKLLDISTRNYQDYEYGKVVPLLPKLMLLADYYDVSIDYLVGRSDDPTRH